MSKTDYPRATDTPFIHCKCDGCGCALENKKVWVWREFTGCSQKCVVKAKKQSDEEVADKDLL